MFIGPKKKCEIAQTKFRLFSLNIFFVYSFRLKFLKSSISRNCIGQKIQIIVHWAKKIVNLQVRPSSRNFFFVYNSRLKFLKFQFHEKELAHKAKTISLLCPYGLKMFQFQKFKLTQSFSLFFSGTEP